MIQEGTTFDHDFYVGLSIELYPCVYTMIIDICTLYKCEYKALRQMDISQAKASQRKFINVFISFFIITKLL